MDPPKGEKRVVGPDGHEYIQAGSRRKDGTYRKPIRVKPGCVDDVVCLVVLL